MMGLFLPRELGLVLGFSKLLTQALFSWEIFFIKRSKLKKKKMGKNS